MNEAEYITPTTWEQCARHGASVASTSESMFTVEIDPDGTIEVLKDGDR